MRESLMMSEVTNANPKDGPTKSRQDGSQVARLGQSEVLRSAGGAGLPGSMVLSKKKI